MNETKILLDNGKNSFDPMRQAYFLHTFLHLMLPACRVALDEVTMISMPK
jgi:hypothetical protein